MSFVTFSDAEIAVGKPIKQALWQKVKDNDDYLYGLLDILAGVGNQILNGSFENDSDADGIPDGWTKSLYPAGSGSLETTSPAHGAKAWKFVHPGGSGNGGGYLDSEYIMVQQIDAYAVHFIHWATAAGMKNKVIVRSYTVAKIFISEQEIYSSTSNPTSASHFKYKVTLPAGARFIKIRIVGGYTDTNVAGTAYFDHLLLIPIVGQEGIRLTSGEVSITSVAGAAASGNLVLPGGEWGFYPLFKQDSDFRVAKSQFMDGYTPGNSSYAALIYLEIASGSGSTSLFAKQPYVAASGKEFWLFFLVDEAGRAVAGYASNDHPCLSGGGGDPDAVPHPFADYWGKPLPEGWEVSLICMDDILRIDKERGDLSFLDYFKRAELSIDRSEEVPWTPRDMDGKRSLLNPSGKWKHRRFK